MIENLEHFRQAALLLVGSGAVKQRLTEAYRSHLLPVRPEVLPAPIDAEFATLMAAFSSAPAAGGLAAAEASVRKMSDQDAARLAQSVLGMLLRLSATAVGIEEATAPPRLRVVGDEDEVPAFLSRA